MPSIKEVDFVYDLCHNSCRKAKWKAMKLPCVCVWCVLSFILDVRLVDVPAEVTQDFSSAFLLRCLP